MQSAAAAFDAIAPNFDSRFGAWQSVAAQRRAVRALLLQQFPPGGRILEVGGGTGEDAAYLAQRGFKVLLTDPSPAMVGLAAAKLAPLGSQAQLAGAEALEEIAERHSLRDGELFDGAFSNFAPLNCVTDLESAARGLARLLKPGAPAMLVLFGTCCPGEMVTELLRGRPRQAFRRLHRGVVHARMGGHEFAITYHRRRDLVSAFRRWFVLEKRFGIGVAVPPSSAEPWISRRPRLLAAMESVDRTLDRLGAVFGDHVLYQFRRLP